ncbi:MAG: FecR domain-containing protein [Granulosicoccus sp.]|nr:FecR domain-containing protein [Granulosicoccus sp.]
MRRVLYVALLINLTALFADYHSSTALAQESPQWQATLVSVEGDVVVRKLAGKWLSAQLNDSIMFGDSINVRQYSRAAIKLPDGAVLRLDQNTTITFVKPVDENRSWLNITDGLIHIISRFPRALKIVTPYANAGIEGTEFSVEVKKNETVVTVLEGVVSVSAAAGAVDASSGQRVSAISGQQPTSQLVIRPEDAVQWSLYYMPILDDEFPATDPDSIRNSNSLVYRAAGKLSVGRVNEAESDIVTALELEPGNSAAVALRSIVALAQNQKNAALSIASEAVALDPDSAAALIALSYVQQANFDLSAALKSLQLAITVEPDNALAWARLSEIWLALEDLDQSLDAAETSIELNPDLALTQIVLGFAYLTRVKTDSAKDAFKKAVVLDQSAPLARLGLGLVHIRNGNLNLGREQIEIAVALDPGNAKIRSYMGKAYDEERRDNLAETQFEISKQLDPQDPTPWFYDAIRKQSSNRPIESLADLYRSIELNDNRAIYRSQFALDSDLAIRGTSVARIYDDLGFDHLARQEASRSLGVTPSNHSAHRFLSDAYSRKPRHEIARVSELLQSQLLQPVNVSPVQPSLPFLYLNSASNFGSFDIGLNEYTSLFESDGPRLLTTLAAGSQKTKGGEFITFGQSKNFSYSAGFSGVDTDGFRINNDENDEIVNVFSQWAVTPKLNLQAEFRNRNTLLGDSHLKFDPMNFDPTLRLNIDETVARIGVQLRAFPGSTTLLSGIYAEKDENRSEGTNFVEDVASSGYELEVQQILESESYSTVAGVGFHESDSSFIDYDSRNMYLYGDFVYPASLRWTIGASFNEVEGSETKTNHFGPKFGLEWTPVNHLTVRAAAFAAPRRPLVVGQSIEPTEIAGFNQFYDDNNGSEAEKYGLGLDLSTGRKFYYGLELTRRVTDFSAGSEFELREEEQISGYFNWIISDSWSFTIDLSYENYRNDLPATNNINTPTQLESTNVPVSFRYFSRSGYFAQVQATYIRQNLERGNNASMSDGEDDVALVDALVGYRFAQKKGAISFSVRNAGGEYFLYQDNAFRSAATTRSAESIPERELLLKASFSFH